MTQLVLMSRSYCHLCHDMEAAVQPFLATFSATLEVLDVDADPALEALYDELVPVLLTQDQQEICHYFLDAPRLQHYLETGDLPPIPPAQAT